MLSLTCIPRKIFTELTVEGEGVDGDALWTGRLSEQGLPQAVISS